MTKKWDSVGTNFYLRHGGGGLVISSRDPRRLIVELGGRGRDLTGEDASRICAASLKTSSTGERRKMTLPEISGHPTADELNLIATGKATARYDGAGRPLFPERRERSRPRGGLTTGIKTLTSAVLPGHISEQIALPSASITAA